MRSLTKVLCFSSIVCLVVSACPWAGWIEDGIPLTPHIGNSKDQAFVVDGSSGTIIVYEACIEGLSHIMLQRVDSEGTPLWGDGIFVCSESTLIGDPQIISDGAGGAIITWHDGRSGNWDVYAQRIDGAGTVLWQTNGVSICADTADQYYPQITSDGGGGAIITWRDMRSGSYSEIYAQRIDASGSLLWQTDGVALCTVPHSKWSLKITSDGAAGAIVAWDDYRNGYWDIYAQRVDASGSALWMIDGIPICTATGRQNVFSIVSDGAYGAIAIWHDDRNGNWDIYMQRMDSSGLVMWIVDGESLCTEMGDQFDPVSVSDGAGGVIVSWYDSRSGAGADIYAQRADPSGTVLWLAGGVPICTATNAQLYPQIASNGEGEVIITWQDYRNSSNYDIYAQRIDASGTMLWQSDGVPVCLAAGRQQYPTIITDNAGGALISWEDQRSEDYCIYIQRLDASGTALWEPEGVPLNRTIGVQNGSEMIADGSGGVIVTWADKRTGSYDIYAQRLDDSGTALWQVNGDPICTAAENQMSPQITTDGAGGAIIVWIDGRNGNDDIYAQHLGASGTVAWDADGVPLCTAADIQWYPKIIADGTGGAIVTWMDFRSGNLDIYAQRVSASGAVLWMADGVPLCTTTEFQLSPVIAPDGTGGAIIAWIDVRSENEDIYAQRVDASGSVLWQSDGVPICTAAGPQLALGIISDGLAGAIISWNDERAASRDIYAQRIDAMGLALWQTDGIPVCATGANQRSPDIVFDSSGGAIITWEDDREGNFDIYAQHLDGSGSNLWVEDGVIVCVAAEDQDNPRIIADGAGGAIITWEDERNDVYNGDIYAQRLHASGSELWGLGGVALCTAMGAQRNPSLAFDGAGGAIVAWEDYRCVESHIYAARVSGSGDLVATLLQSYAARIESGSVRITWTLSEIDESASFTILRASAPDWIYFEIEDTRIEIEGLSFSFTDIGCLPGSTVKYRVDVETEGTPTRTLFETEEITVPALPLTLYQNHPNPFNPNTTIRFYLPEAQEVSLDIYNVAGQRIIRLAEGRREKGYQEALWDGRNSWGAESSSGIYFYRLRAGKSSISRKMVLLR